MYPAYDQLVSEAARIRYRSAGDFTVPLTVRMPYGGGIRGGQTHSQSPEALFTHVAGLKENLANSLYLMIHQRVIHLSPLLFLSTLQNFVIPA
jgi:2-oxoisovalerate dehydrogenase E1 component beta subunit